MSGLRVGVLVNCTAGTAERQDPSLLREQLAEVFARRDVTADVSLVAGDALRRAAEGVLQAVRAGALDAVVVAGGDGSIRTVAGVLAGSGVPLGVIPLGTRNHFARDLAIPLDVEEAIAIIATRATRPVDLGEVNGELFINNSSIGLYPYMVLLRERKRRRIFPKGLAMIAALPDVVRTFPMFRLIVRVAGQSEPCRSPIVFVGNNEYRLALPAFGRRDRLDRGELWVYVAKAPGWRALLWTALRSLLGLSLGDDELRAMSGATAEITTRRRRHLMVACDGELLDIRPPLHYRSRPGALQVFAPSNGP